MHVKVISKVDMLSLWDVKLSERVGHHIVCVLVAIVKL